MLNLVSANKLANQQEIGPYKEERSACEPLYPARVMNALSETDGRLYSFWGRYFAEPKFRERLDARIRRLVLAYALRPKRIGLLPRLTALTLAHVIAPTRSTHELLGRAPYRKEGLIGISNDLSVGRC